MMFYGRQRKGLPWLLIAMTIAIVALALSFAIPGGADMWRAFAPVAVGVLIACALVAAIVAALRPRRRR
jgi:uncharacterized membrane protein YccC